MVSAVYQSGANVKNTRNDKTPKQTLSSSTNQGKCPVTKVNKNVQIAIGLTTRTTTLHLHYIFWYTSLPSLHD